MRKRLLCGILTAGMFLGSALAAETAFPDVGETDWFAPYVSVCVENGLMNGTDNGFEPGRPLTNGEAAALCARIRERLTGQAIPLPAPGESAWPWTYPYTSYLEEAIRTLGDHEEAAQAVATPAYPATRSGFMALLALAAEGVEDVLPAINSIAALPDTDDADVLAFYNAGVTTGVDGYGTFAGDRTLTRSEAAAMAARILEPGLRQSFTPQALPAGEPEAVLDDQVVLVVNGQEMSTREFAFWLIQVAYYWDSNYYSNFGTRLVWDEDAELAILTQARDQAVGYMVMSAKARELGCSLQELSAALTPSPTREELAAYAAREDLLRAKHILVADEASAQSIIASLDAQPTQLQFDNILSLLGTDPGMASNPDGYLFTAGEMVAEFEQGVRALEIGGYSPQPVQSSFGFHVILRLDPLDHPDLIPRYQDAVMNDLVDQWVAQARVQVNEAVLGQIDVQSTYELYLQALIQSGS